jgi:hypothetical protein
MNNVKIMNAVLNNKYYSDFKLEFSEDKNNQPIGKLTVPFVSWADSENSFLSHRVLSITGKELECIDKTFFDNKICEIPVQGYPYPVEMCDILYKVIPPKIYNQMLSNTFKINENADPKIYKNFLELENKNNSSIKDLINTRKKQNININSTGILFAKTLEIPHEKYILALSNSNHTFELQLHDMKDNKCYRYNKTELGSYSSKKIFDSINTPNNINQFKSYSDIKIFEIQNNKKNLEKGRNYGD